MIVSIFSESNGSKCWLVAFQIRLQNQKIVIPQLARLRYIYLTFHTASSARGLRIILSLGFSQIKTCKLNLRNLNQFIYNMQCFLY